MTAVLQQQPEERNADRQTSGWCKGENERAFESDTYSLPQKGAVPRGRKVTFGCQTGLCSRETAEIQPPAPGETSKHKLHSTRLDFAKVFLHRHSRVRTRSCATHRLNMSEQPPLSAAGPKPSSSLLGRLANVYADPSEVFDEIKTAPASVTNWLVPVLLGCLVGILYTLVVFSQENVLHSIRERQEARVRKQFHKQAEAGKMSREQADRAAD